MESYHHDNDDITIHVDVIFTMGKGSLYSRSSKQKLNTKSSTESELVAISDALPRLLAFPLHPGLSEILGRR